MSLLCDFAINYLSNVGWYLQDNKMQVFIKNLSVTLFNVIQFSNTLQAVFINTIPDQKLTNQWWGLRLFIYLVYV